ncbi:hypothetical protein TWF706_010348 [Orbilia oligospora]|nr:hypothetical protein TWF706_010348 [Orbilia oligospora]
MSGCACNRDILLFFDQKLPGLSFFSWYLIEVCDFCEWDDIIRIIYCNSHAPRYPSKYLHYEQTEPDRSEKCACGSHQKTWRFPLEEDLQLEDNKGTNPDLVVPWDTANLDIQPSYTKAISATFKQYATASKVREINEALLKRDNSLLLDQTSFHQIFPEGERNIGLWFKLCFFVKGTPISDTLTILHISGDVLALPRCKEERSKNVVKVLNLLFENLCQLRSLSWREIGPCNEYAFYDLAEAPKYLRNFQLLQKQSDLSSKGYTKMTANYGDSLPERYLDICERFWKIIQSNFLDLFHENEHHLRITTLESGNTGLHAILETVIKTQADQMKQAMGITKRHTLSSDEIAKDLSIEQQKKEADECLQQIQNDMEIFIQVILKQSMGLQTIMDTINNIPERIRTKRVIDQELIMQ